jgi:hypothetical protein
VKITRRGTKKKKGRDKEDPSKDKVGKKNNPANKQITKPIDIKKNYRRGEVRKSKK